eukprot:2600664-Karenia_brevis.AAC.1
MCGPEMSSRWGQNGSKSSSKSAMMPPIPQLETKTGPKKLKITAVPEFKMLCGRPHPPAAALGNLVDVLALQFLAVF